MRPLRLRHFVVADNQRPRHGDVVERPFLILPAVLPLRRAHRESPRRYHNPARLHADPVLPVAFALDTIATSAAATVVPAFPPLAVGEAVLAYATSQECQCLEVAV